MWDVPLPSRRDAAIALPVELKRIGQKGRQKPQPLGFSSKFKPEFLSSSVVAMDGGNGELDEHPPVSKPAEKVERSDKRGVRAVQELLKTRSETEITIEATVDTGFEFMAVEECREKFGADFSVMKERGSILFNIDKSKYCEVKQMRSVDNLFLVVSYDPIMGLKGTNSADDVNIAKQQAHKPEWDLWLNVWKELSGFEGIVKPTPEQFATANDRATKDKEAEKVRQAERQKKFKERHDRNAEKRARRKAKVELRKSQRVVGPKCTDNDKSESPKEEGDKPADLSEKIEQKLKVDVPEMASDVENPDDRSHEPQDHPVDVQKEASTEDPASDFVDSEDEIQSLPDYEREIDREIDAGVPADERVLRFRATCFRVGKHSFGSMEIAREFGGELQEKFNWVVDLVNFNAEIILFLMKDTAQVSIALTRRSLHRRNISFFGPTTLRSTVCHNLLRLADIKPGDVILDPLAGGGSIPIEGAMSFPGTFYIGGDIHPKAMSRFYSNNRVLQEEIKKGLPLDAVRWDSRRLPLAEASVDVIVTDLPFGVRLGSKSGNRNLYRRVLLEMARVARPGIGRAILLTQDRKSFALALVNCMGLWWQSRVMHANIGGLDAAVFTLRRTAKERPDAADLAAAAEQAKERSSWRDGGGLNSGNKGGHGHGHGGRGRGRGGGRGRPYPRGNRSAGNTNWRENKPSTNKNEA